MSPDPILDDLNPAQREAVEAVDGPLLILAGPGSGKTRVITHRIAYLVLRCGVHPRSIAAVTFTNKAAREMRDRLFGRSDGDSSSPLLGGLWQMRSDFSVATFHALCAQILRREADSAGLDRAFVIYDQEDQLGVVQQAMEQLQIDAKRFPPRSMLSAISAAKSQLIEPDAYAGRLSGPMERYIGQTYQRYQEMLHSNNAVDFDDLLLKTHALFRDSPSALDKYRSRYEYLLIDEFQDTNVAQYAIAQLLASKHGNICVVGDPDQAIYSWRNADIRNILSFERDYPDARKVTLVENYRSTETILEAATGVISANRQRIGKELVAQNERGSPLFVDEAYNPEEEAQKVIGEIERLNQYEGRRLGDCAVMYRINAQSRALEEHCLRFGIPYKLIGGLRFYQRKEIKDVVAYLRVIHNPYDEVSLRRIINVPPRGIGDRTMDQVVHKARLGNVPVYTAVQLMAEDGDGGRPNRALARFLHIINTLMEFAGTLPVEELIDAVLERTGYGDHLRAEGEQGLERLENIRELRTTAREFQPMDPDERLATFLESVALVSDVDTLEEGGDGITLITLHQAKGLEFPVVFIVGLEEGLLPHSRSIDDPDQLEEERRLFYVGMTRAKERLYLTRAFRRGFWGNTSASRPSRFLGDVPQRLITSMTMAGERVAAPERGSVGSGAGRGADGAKPPLRDGDHVRHFKFGEGVVVSCVATGQDHEVTVAFKGESGIKKLLYSFAPLEKVE